MFLGNYKIRSTYYLYEQKLFSAHNSSSFKFITNWCLV